MRWSMLACAATAVACTPTPSLPGDQQMGTFGFSASPLERVCGLDEVAGAAFTFSATFSRNSGDARAWVTMQGYSRGAEWDGQLFSSTAVARRAFAACAQCSTSVEEQLAVALLSRTQSVAAGGCPNNPLDGGVPPVDVDAGITAPMMTALGFDALSACGELATVVRGTDGGDCPAECDGCRVRYQLVGARQ